MPQVKLSCLAKTHHVECVYSLGVKMAKMCWVTGEPLPWSMLHLPTDSPLTWL